jgi:hypothetical protein
MEMNPGKFNLVLVLGREGAVSVSVKSCYEKRDKPRAEKDNGSEALIAQSG